MSTPSFNDQEIIDGVCEGIRMMRQQQDVVVMVLVNQNTDEIYGITAGLTLHGLPELIMFGRTPDVIGHTLYELVKMTQAKGALAHDWYDAEEEVASAPLQVKNLQPAQSHDYTGGVSKYMREFGKWPSFQQVVVPDPQGRKVTDPDYDTHYMQAHYKQPHLWEQAVQVH